MRAGLAVLACMALAACSGGGEPARRAPPRTTSAKPNPWALPTERETRACLANLDKVGIDFRSIPDRNFGGGCQVVGAVQLIDIGVPVTNLKAMRCGLAEDFTGWVRNAVAPAARQILGSDLVRVETFGTYACRNIVTNNASFAKRLSGHAIANAVDVSGFVLQNGRRVTILQGWRSQDAQERAFLRTIHASACKRFGTVLSPDYNAVHQNHLHLEADHANFCR